MCWWQEIASVSLPSGIPQTNDQFFSIWFIKNFIKQLTLNSCHAKDCWLFSPKVWVQSYSLFIEFLLLIMLLSQLVTSFCLLALFHIFSFNPVYPRIVRNEGGIQTPFPPCLQASDEEELVVDEAVSHSVAVGRRRQQRRQRQRKESVCSTIGPCVAPDLLMVCLWVHRRWPDVLDDLLF